MDAAEFNAARRVEEMALNLAHDLNAEFGIVAEVRPDNFGFLYLSIPTAHAEAVEAQFTDEDGGPEWIVATIKWDRTGGITSETEHGVFGPGWTLVCAIASAVAEREAYWTRMEALIMEGAE